MFRLIPTIYTSLRESALAVRGSLIRSISSSRYRSVDAARDTKTSWITALLAVASALFMASGVWERLALNDFRSHVVEMASNGGGVLFVMSPADCQRTSTNGIVNLVTDGLRTVGVPVLGLLVDDGTDTNALRALQTERAQHLRHELVNGRGVAAYLGRLGTPLALGVGPTGHVWVIEHLSLSNVADVPGLVRRLQKVVGTAQ